MNYAEALQQLSQLGMLGIKPGTERLAEALRRLENPQDRFVSLHIAGTNGKGSTAAFSASLLVQAAGQAQSQANAIKPVRVGLYTSPHLCRVRERIRLTDENAPQLRECSEDEFASALSRIFAACAAPPVVELTFFEVVTAAAFLIFAEQGVEVAVIETGLGGRLDATRLCLAEATVVTSIGFDHTELLGPTLSAIAREKAGIFRPGVPAIVACDDDAARAVLIAEAQRVAAPLWLYEPRGEAGVTKLAELPESLVPALPLVGAHQKRNAALALFGVLSLKLARQPELHAALRRPDVQRAGLSATRWPGRLERIWPAEDSTQAAAIATRLETPLPAGCEVWLDAAHNPEGAEVLARFIADSRGDRALTVLFGVVAGKDAAAMVAPLAHAQQVILTRPPSPRGLDPAQLLPILQRPAEVIADWQPALDRAIAATRPGGILLIYGSLFLIGALRSLWFGEAMDPLWLQDPAARRSAQGTS